MKKYLYLAALLALPLLATPARADGWIFPFTGNASVNFRWNINCGSTTGGGYQLGPWYHYWPLEAHFVTPAPTGYPYWPQPQALLPNPMLPQPQPQPMPPPKPDPKAGPEVVKPVGYYYYSQSSYPAAIRYGPAPSYWDAGR